MAAAADRHMLFGLIALQVGLIDQCSSSPPSKPGHVTRNVPWPTFSSTAAISTRTSARLWTPWSTYT